MLKHTKDISAKYLHFVESVVETGKVFTLAGDGESALCTSLHFTDEEGNPAPVMCFWSAEALANFHLQEDWSEFELKTIFLAPFLENWCLGMFFDNVIVGVNFDQQLFGQEVNALQLASDIIDACEKKSINFELKNFTDISHLKEYILSLDTE